MLGLDDYASSDEENQKVKVEEASEPEISAQPQDESATGKSEPPHRLNPQQSVAVDKQQEGPEPGPSPLKEQRQEAADGPLVGPVGPSMSDAPANGSASRSESPYSLNRSVMRDLTLPPIPNLDIPPSPPGSPSASTTAKFSHFLELKKQGVHFNEKLARSSALKNPSLLQKLTDFAGISEQDQYATALPKELWDPTDFPSWAYKEELAKSQQEILKRKEEETKQAQRQALDFVPAGGDQRTPSELARTTGRSAAERVMAGLDRERSRTPNAPNGERRRQASRRGD